MTRKISALTARTQFGQIMERAVEHDERFLVDRRGQPAVVIMSVDDYLHSVAPEDPVVRSIRNRAEAKGLDRLTLEEINAEISASRQQKRARDKAV
ncbi:MAG: type II toxin-antitoxin system prevent-host-death family antitoxin [Bryobacteraceae bacterium]|nr:type II toxin-antitoxin system prevent-host-death family antitoxin [Bryobacteraceae bacterium]